jgi:hypothetical protein
MEATDYKAAVNISCDEAATKKYEAIKELASSIGVLARSLCEPSQVTNIGTVSVTSAAPAPYGVVAKMKKGK